MKLSEVFGVPLRTIPFSPLLAKVAGSISAAILLAQLLHWTGKGQDPDGWIYKSSEELELETGLTYDQQMNARLKLRARGLIQERYRRRSNTLYFKVNLEVLTGAVNEHLRTATGPVEQVPPIVPSTQATAEPNPDSGFPETGFDQMGKPDLQLSRNGDSGFPELGFDQIAKPELPISLNGTSPDYQETTPGGAARAAQAPATPHGTPGWDLAHGLRVSEAQLERERLRDQATSAFESALGVNAWPWCTTRVWERMADLVEAAWSEDRDVFREFTQWMRGEARFIAMSVKQIRINPQQFIDTGWPMFLASRRPAEPEPEQEDTDLGRRLKQGVGIK